MIITHELKLEGESFEISHVERRLYKFANWKKARESLIKILLSRLKESIGVESAYIDFKMANPFRRSRLGNFYIEVSGTISSDEHEGSIKDFGLDNLSIENYVTLDKEEKDIRLDVELKYSKEQYIQESALRSKSLKLVSEELNFSIDRPLSLIVEKMMDKEGWSKTKNNKIHSRINRVDKKINLKD